MDGYYRKEIKVKKEATPIDNITKFAWDDNDYEIVEVWHEYTAEELERKKRSDENKEQKELFNTLPDAVSDLSEVVSTNATDLTDINNAVAELSELVSNILTKEG